MRRVRQKLIERRSSIAVINVAFGILFGVGRAHAQNAQAERLFEEGNKLMADGKLAEACAAFEASNRVEPRAGTLIRLGECREQDHQLASAWSAYKDSLNLATDPRKQKFATTRAASLEPRLSYLTVAVSDQSRIRGLVLTRNGTSLDPMLWNRALPVDGGDYVIAARAPGYETWQRMVHVPAEGTKLGVDVPALAKAGKVTASGVASPPTASNPPAAAAPTSPAVTVPVTTVVQQDVHVEVVERTGKTRVASLPTASNPPAAASTASNSPAAASTASNPPAAAPTPPAVTVPVTTVVQQAVHVEVVEPADKTRAATDAVPAPSIRRYITIGAGIAGVGAVGIGLLLAAKASSTYGDAKALCMSLACDPADYDKGKQLIRDAHSDATAATVLVAAGGAAIAASAILFLTIQSERAQATARIVPTIYDRGTGLAIIGRF